MKTLTLALTAMAHGGAAVGRDPHGKTIFVPGAIPGEQVRVGIVEDKGRYARARLLEVLQPAAGRVIPRCPHFGAGCDAHYQHIAYPQQLQYKQEVVRDQLRRVGGLNSVVVRPVLPNPQPWQGQVEIRLSPASGGGLGLWAADLGRVIPLKACYTIRPPLLELLQDVDLELPGLRHATLRVGDGDALLVTLVTENAEPPQLEADFPVSVALVLPDGTAATLIGDPYLAQTVKGREFRVSAGAFFHPSPPAADLLVDAVVTYAALTGGETLLELYSGVGLLTAFLSPQAAVVVCVEANPDAVGDAAVNLEETDNVSLYEGRVEDILPALVVEPEVVVVDPPAAGLPMVVIEEIGRRPPQRLIYVSSDVGSLARDGRQLAAAGFRLVEVQPVDMFPQSFHVQTISLWRPL
ncbi:MAG: TRAM domain-containing protein [Chloroflexota bacterium]